MKSMSHTQMSLLDSLPDAWPLDAWRTRPGAPYASNDDATPDFDRPDPRYWTAYDHFMLEREARRIRSEYTYALVVSAVRWIKTRAAALLARSATAASSVSKPARPQA
jgi:hypothetical protein